MFASHNSWKTLSVTNVGNYITTPPGMDVCSVLSWNMPGHEISGLKRVCTRSRMWRGLLSRILHPPAKRLHWRKIVILNIRAAVGNYSCLAIWQAGDRPACRWCAAQMPNVYNRDYFTINQPLEFNLIGYTRK